MNMEALINNGGLIAILVCSLIFCFFGYRFFTYLLSLAGAIIFGSVGWRISMEFFDSEILYSLPIAIVAAIFGAWLFHKLFKLAAFLYGASAGYFALSPIVFSLIASEQAWVKWAVPIGCALAGGMLLVISHRLIMIIMTSASGALNFTVSLYLLLVELGVLSKETLEKPDKIQSSLWIFCFAITALSGLIYQLKDKNSKDSDS
jgi:hypothetical protein